MGTEAEEPLAPALWRTKFKVPARPSLALGWPSGVTALTARPPAGLGSWDPDSEAALCVEVLFPLDRNQRTLPTLPGRRGQVACGEPCVLEQNRSSRVRTWLAFCWWSPSPSCSQCHLAEASAMLPVPLRPHLCPIPGEVAERIQPPCVNSR